MEELTVSDSLLSSDSGGSFVKGSVSSGEEGAVVGENERRRKEREKRSEGEGSEVASGSGSSLQSTKSRVIRSRENVHVQTNDAEDPSRAKEASEETDSECCDGGEENGVADSCDEGERDEEGCSFAPSVGEDGDGDVNTGGPADRKEGRGRGVSDARKRNDEEKLRGLSQVDGSRDELGGKS